MSSGSPPLLLDLADFDAVGITTDVVVAIRSHAIQAEIDTSASISAPEGWHRVIVNCSATGKTVLRVRFGDLTTSRANNVSSGLVEQGWQIDEDRDGASQRYPSGVEASTVAFDALGAVGLGGSPRDVRSVTASDRAGTAVPL